MLLFYPAQAPVADWVFPASITWASAGGNSRGETALPAPAPLCQQTGALLAGLAQTVLGQQLEALLQ